MINVLVVDDHELVRVGITRLLSDVSGIKVVAEAKSGEEAIKIVKEKNPHVILMDVKMPGIGGLEATRKLLRQNRSLKIIALSIYGEEPFPTKLLQAGAMGYLTKGAHLEEMITAIRTVYSGKRYLSPEIAQQMALKSFSFKNDSPFDILSEREMQITIMITNGQKVQEISEKLCLSLKTIHSYRYRIFEKLNISTDVELTHLALRHGVLDPEVV